jgi:hypothetical protein
MEQLGRILKSPWSRSVGLVVFLDRAGEQILQCNEVRFATLGNITNVTNRAKSAAGIQQGAFGGVDPLVRVSQMSAQRSAGSEIVVQMN